MSSCNGTRRSGIESPKNRLNRSDVHTVNKRLLIPFSVFFFHLNRWCSMKNTLMIIAIVYKLHKLFNLHLNAAHCLSIRIHTNAFDWVSHLVVLTAKLATICLFKASERAVNRQLEVITWKLFKRNKNLCGTWSKCLFHIRVLSLRRFRKTNKFKRVLRAALLFLLWVQMNECTSRPLLRLTWNNFKQAFLLIVHSFVPLRFLASHNRRNEETYPRWKRETNNFLGCTQAVKP